MRSTLIAMSCLVTVSMFACTSSPKRVVQNGTAGAPGTAGAGTAGAGTAGDQGSAGAGTAGDQGAAGVKSAQDAQVATAGSASVVAPPADSSMIGERPAFSDTRPGQLT